MKMRFAMLLLQMLQIIKLKYSAQLTSKMSFHFQLRPCDNWAGWVLAASSKCLCGSPLLLHSLHSFPAELNSSCESLGDAQCLNPSEHPLLWSWMSHRGMLVWDSCCSQVCWQQHMLVPLHSGWGFQHLDGILNSFYCSLILYPPQPAIYLI